jgi:cyanophycinase
MLSRLLFLIGGSEGGILDKVAEEFVPVARGRDATIALLMIGGPGWDRYVPEYVQPWERQGATKHHVIVPRDDGVLDTEATAHRLREATGIFIAGGQTSRYLDLYASEPIASIIRERCDVGIPFAGLSAGARMAPRHCCLFPTPKAPDQVPTIAQGVGLVSDLVVEVHFDESPSGLDHLLDGMSKTHTRRGLGIGAAACAILDNGQLRRVLGSTVYEVTMTDFESQRYEMTEVAPGS